VPHCEQSLSVAHVDGHLGWQRSAQQRSVAAQALESSVVQATQWLLFASQTWWSGSQATQSPALWQAMVGVPCPSTGQLEPVGTQSP
jgi:hypothetical protein